MHIGSKKTLRLIVIAALCLLCSTCSILFAKLNIVVSIPVEKYVLTQLLPGLADVKTILDGEHEPHLEELTPSIIRLVEESDLYIPVSHFEFEFNLVKMCRSRGIPVVEISIESLKILRYPGTGIENTHGWWLLPENILVFARSVVDTLAENYPEAKHDLHMLYTRFAHDVERVSKLLQAVGREIVQEAVRKNVLIVCASPAVQYLLKAMSINCSLILQEGRLTPEAIITIEKHKGPLLVLLANFQHGSDLERTLSDYVEAKSGVLVYVPVLGLERLNLTYTEFLAYLAGLLLESVKSIETKSTTEITGKVGVVRESADNIIYLCYVLTVILAISLVINVSLLRRVRRR